MQQIFISYSSRHRELTRQLAAVLEAQYGPGSVWWDDALEARGPYTGQIDAALAAARVVVVVWTVEATCSTWVRAEATAADAAGKLVNLRPPELPPGMLPAPFNLHQVEEIGATGRILRAIDSVMAGRPLPTVIPLHELYERQYRQRLVDPKQSALPDDVFDISPSQLLQARYEQVGYLDATGQRDAMRRWALEHPRRAAGRLLHGPGGIGKTRLLIDLAAQLRREHGWRAGFVERVPPQADDAQRRQRRQALQQLVELGPEPGLLLVLDYAEGRREELTELAEWIENRVEPTRRPLRLVLLARGAGEWWQRLTEERPEVQVLFGERPSWPALVALPPFDSPAQRLALFDAACAAYRPVLQQQGLACPAGDAPEDLRQRIASGEKRSRPLSIQMEALVWLAGGAGHGGAGGVAGLLDQVLGLERRHWATVCGALDEATLTELERGVAQLTLVQGVPEAAAADALLERDAYFGSRRREPVDRVPVLSRLGRLYGDGSGGLLPLEPDLLGEHLVARVGEERLLDACVGWVDAIDDATAGAARERRLHLVTVLQRGTAQEHGDPAAARVGRLIARLLEAHLARWALAVVSTVVETPGALLAHLQARTAVLDIDALAALNMALPLRSLALDPVALDTAWRLLEHARTLADNAADDDVDRQSRLAARSLTWGLRLSAMGRREDALSATGEAVQIYRGLARTRPDAFEPDLAASLNNLGSDLADLGRREEALAATDEAVQIYRRLAQARPDAFGPDLALGLSNLGIRLAELGRHEDALAAADEAVQIYRGLAHARPDAFEPGLAMSLNNLGNMFSDLGRSEDALAATGEAVQIRRRLAQPRPDAFWPDLAMSLNNLGRTLSDLGRREDALAAAEEAAQIRRRLAQARPDAFGPDLASSLNNLSGTLFDLCRREDALAVIDEAVQIYRGLAQVRPDAFGADLARSLGAHAMALADMGRHAEAATIAEEGLATLLPLLRRYPEALGKLALSLARDHLRHAEAAAREPNGALLTEVAPILGLDPRDDADAQATS